MSSPDRRKRLRPPTIRKPIGLALQGGGSSGAFTWGALDALLASRRIAVAELSGTSAGAINAAIVAGALANGSTARAREALRSFWLSITDHAATQGMHGWWGPVDRHWRNPLNEWLLASGILPPHHASAFAANLLRHAIAKHVDIEAIRSRFAPALFVTVTNVKTGLPRVISNDAMSIDALTASACVRTFWRALSPRGGDES